MNKFLPELIKIARTQLPAIQYSIQNGSTTLALREAVENLFNITWVMMSYILEDAAAQTRISRGPIAPAPTAAPPSPIAPAPVAPPVVAPRVNPADALDALVSALPPPPSMAQPVTAPASMAPASQGPDIQPGVTNVVITSQSTQVVAPSGARAILPPGAPVDLATSSGAPPELPPAPPGVEQVVLPPGGGMSAEVLAALSGRSNDQPPQ